MTIVTPTTTWISVNTAAARMELSRRTIHAWLKAGKLNWRRTVSGSTLIDEASLWDDYQGTRRVWEPRPTAGAANLVHE